MKYFLIACVATLVCSCATELTPEEKQKRYDDSVLAVHYQKFTDDSLYCINWRNKMDAIRKQLPDTHTVLLANYATWTGGFYGDVSSMPLLTYSFFMDPANGETPLDKYIFSKNEPITYENRMAEAERDVVWESLERRNYLFIYYPYELTVKGTINDDDPVSGTTKGTVVVYDLTAGQIAGTVEVNASHNTQVEYDAFSGTTMTNVVYRELRQQIGEQVLKN